MLLVGNFCSYPCKLNGKDYRCWILSFRKHLVCNPVYSNFVFIAFRLHVHFFFALTVSQLNFICGTGLTSKYFRCYEIYKEMILEITKRRVIMKTKRIIQILVVKKVTYELTGPVAKIGAPQADNDSSDPPEIFHKNVFLTKTFDLIILYSCWKMFNQPFLIVSVQIRRANK